jgi:hypothetical protein
MRRRARIALAVLATTACGGRVVTTASDASASSAEPDVRSMPRSGSDAGTNDAESSERDDDAACGIAASCTTPLVHITSSPPGVACKFSAAWSCESATTGSTYLLNGTCEPSGPAGSAYQINDCPSAPGGVLSFKHIGICVCGDSDELGQIIQDQWLCSCSGP